MLWFRNYYSTVFNDGGKRARIQYRKSLQAILNNPHIGRLTDEQNMVREYAIIRTPFSIVYFVHNDTIEILHIWDNRQIDTDVD
jgi:plasmid stabilization system protein ParE